MIKKSLTGGALLAALIAQLGTASAALAQEPKSPQFWWPEQLNLQPLRQHAAESNPMGEEFDYAEEFATLNDGTVT